MVKEFRDFLDKYGKMSTDDIKGEANTACLVIFTNGGIDNYEKIREMLVDTCTFVMGTDFSYDEKESSLLFSIFSRLTKEKFTLYYERMMANPAEKMKEIVRYMKSDDSTYKAYLKLLACICACDGIVSESEVLFVEEMLED